MLMLVEILAQPAVWPSLEIESQEAEWDEWRNGVDHLDPAPLSYGGSPSGITNISWQIEADNPEAVAEIAVGWYVAALGTLQMPAHLVTRLLVREPPMAASRERLYEMQQVSAVLQWTTGSLLQIDRVDGSTQRYFTAQLEAQRAGQHGDPIAALAQEVDIHMLYVAMRNLAKAYAGAPSSLTKKQPLSAVITVGAKELRHLVEHQDTERNKPEGAPGATTRLKEAFAGAVPGQRSWGRGQGWTLAGILSLDEVRKEIGTLHEHAYARLTSLTESMSGRVLAVFEAAEGKLRRVV